MRHRRRRRRRLHSQIHRVTTGALHASGTSHVHQQSPTSATNQLRHRLCAMRRHGSHRAAQRTSHITGSRWIHQQSVTTATYQLSLLLRSLHRLLLIRHHHHHYHRNESPQISLLSFSQALNLRTISRPLPLPLHQQRFFLSFFFPSLSLSSARIPPQVYRSIKSLHILQSNNNPLELALSPDRCHTPPRQIRCEETRGLRCNRSSYVGVAVAEAGTEKQHSLFLVSTWHYANPSPLPPPKRGLKKALKPQKIGGN